MLIGVVAAGLMVLVAGLLPYQATQRFAEANENLRHQYATLGALDSMQRELPTAIAELRDYTITGETVLLDASRAALARMQENEARTAELLADEPKILGEFHKLQQLLREREANLKVAEAVAAGGPAAVLATVDRPLARKQTAAVNEAFAALRSQLDGYIAERESTLAKALHRLQLMLALFLTASLVVLTVLYRIAMRTRARRKAELAEREFAAALQQKGQALEMANKELESFSYSVSHDLRAPLRAIEGYAAILAEDYAAQLDDTGQRYLQNIRDGATRMGVLIQDLLSFSRLNRQSMTPTDCDTAVLVQAAWQTVRTARPDLKAQLTVLTLPHCTGDARLLEQVWMNLLDNAAKYSSKTPEPQITVRAEKREDGREVLFHVEDNGAGFDMRYADKLFNVFQRLHSESQFPGTGVGLAIVQRIILRHGGRVFARGESGKGACFSFALPLGSPT